MPNPDACDFVRVDLILFSLLLLSWKGQIFFQVTNLFQGKGSSLPSLDLLDCHPLPVDALDDDGGKRPVEVGSEKEGVAQLDVPPQGRARDHSTHTLGVKGYGCDSPFLKVFLTQ